MAKHRLRRYHHKVHLPDNIGEMVLDFMTVVGDKDIGFTHHADSERLKDKRGVIPEVTKTQLFDNANTLVECYEILVKGGRRSNKIQKLVIRLHNLDDKFDYTYVIAREGFIVSNWANDKNDDHRLTQGDSIYYKPPK